MLMIGDAVGSFAAREGFSQHNLVLRPQCQDDLRIQKGITDWPRLKFCFDECLAQSNYQLVCIEMDLRAFANLSRMQHIKQATLDLLHHIQSSCLSAKL